MPQHDPRPLLSDPREGDPVPPEGEAASPEREPTPPERKPGLRERKKARTRYEIQRHALRLFLDQGFDATTVEQIAEAADVSPSTFFRYFPTKVAVVLADDLDSVFLASFHAQPPEIDILQAFRNALGSVFADLAPDELATLRARGQLYLSTPELRAAVLDDVIGSMRVLSTAVAERTGRSASDPQVMTLCGAILGAWVATSVQWLLDPDADTDAVVEGVWRLLDSGLRL